MSRPRPTIRSLGAVSFVGKAPSENRLSVVDQQLIVDDEIRARIEQAKAGILNDEQKRTRAETSALLQKPGKTLPAHAVGHGLIEAGKYEQAQFVFMALLESNGDVERMAEAHVGLAEIAFRRNDFPMAIRHLTMEILLTRSKPHKASRYLLLARLMMETGHTSAASDACRVLERGMEAHGDHAALQKLWNDLSKKTNEVRSQFPASYLA